jgi:anaerobic magnesium-protoporphyrin IX monomethyl ester cyclase
MPHKKVLFITPSYHCGVVEVAGHWIPLQFVYLGGAVREAGFEPIVYDAMTKRHSLETIAKKIADVNPDYVATTAITATVLDALEVLRVAKEINPDIITIIGGVHPTFLYDEVLENKYVDYVVRGEGEETIKELLLALEGGRGLDRVRGIAYRSGRQVITTSARPFIQDLDGLSPAWDLIDWKDYRYFVIPRSRLGAVSTSRGCSHNCAFCSQQKFWHQSWRGRQPESVVKELEHLTRTYGVNVFLIPDEHPTQDRERWERLLDLLIERDLGIYLLMETRAEDIVRDRDILYKYRKAGVVHIYIGVEATRQETLDLIKKDMKVETGAEAIRLIHEHGMITETSFILGFPDETKKSIRNTLRLSKFYNPDFAHFLALAPWPYADMFKELEPYIAVRDYRKYNLIEPVIKPEKMSIKAVDKAIIDCYQSFYMSKLKEILSMEDAFKRGYLLRSMKLIMSSSFIVDKLGSLGRIPPQVNALLNKLEKEKVADEGVPQDSMSEVSRSVKINAPLGKVFEYVVNPLNWPSYVMSLVSVKNLSNKVPVSGTTFEWTYRMLGLNLKGKGRVLEYEKDKKFAVKMHGAFPIIETFLFEGDSKATRLTIKINYEVPGKVLGVLADKLLIEKINAKEAETVLKKIKMICESESATM